MGIFSSIANLLDHGEDLVVATIVSRSGSAPRAVGTRMIVRQDGASIGPIGGGLLESRVQDLARETFGHGQTVLNKYPLTAGEAGRMGMVCGGDIRPLFPRPVSPTCRRPGKGACEPSSAAMTTRPWTWRS